VKLLYRGAEADVFQGEWCGREAVFKTRRPLAYRLPELDRLIRTRRTVHEAQAIHASRLAGVSAPHLYYLSPEEALIVMEFVEGARLKTLLLDAKTSSSKVEASGAEFGRSIAKLHNGGIVHGDLTTSNAIVNSEGITLIDFGLAIQSKRLEDQAVDLRLIKETLTGAHNNVARRFMSSLLKGYASVLGQKRTDAATRKLGEIERRGRYARVE